MAIKKKAATQGVTAYIHKKTSSVTYEDKLSSYSIKQVLLLALNLMPTG
jgi:hypothetical protein